MTITERIHARAALIALAVLAVIGGGVAYAATRTRPATGGGGAGTGVVVIETSLGLQDGAAAGTGMVLTSSGEVLTNNHVIAGATKIRVVLPGTGRSYSASVVGYDKSDDVAVLQLKDASGLRTVPIGNGSLAVGDQVTAIGNAGGTGSLTSARGAVTALDATITAQDENGGGEQLTGLIETSAALQPGDSGGPLEDSRGRVVGMDTAASTGFSFTSSNQGDGYAIPIGTALRIARQITDGTASSTVHIGPTAMIGVQIADSPSGAFGDGFGAATSDGATITGVVSGGPAEAAGLASGDLITAADGQAVSSASALQPIIGAHKPGDRISITYVDTGGQTHTVDVTLASGPPQ